MIKIIAKAVLPMSSAEAERSFSCLRQINTWLRDTMTVGNNIGVLGLHGFDVPVNIDSICEGFKSKNPRGMRNPSVLYE